MFVLRLFYYEGKVFGKPCHLHVPSCILDPATSVFVRQFLCSLCVWDGKQDSGWDLMVASGWLKATNHLESLSFEWVLFPWVPGLPELRYWLWVLLESQCCWVVGDLVPAVVGLHHPEGCLVLWYIGQALTMKYHIQALVSGWTFWLSTLLASRGQETRSLRVTGSEAFFCLCSIDFEGIFFFLPEWWYCSWNAIRGYFLNVT